MIGLWITVAMIGGIFVGFPISFTLIFLGLIFGYWGFGQLVFYQLTLQFNATMMEQTLAAVPFFVFMGIMMEQANLMERLFNAVQKMLSRPARFALPRGDVRSDDLRSGHRHRRRLGHDPRHHGRQVDDSFQPYDVKLSSGLIAAGGTLGILIPPSIMLVVMGPVLRVPVTTLFAAAIVPGLLLALLFTAYAMIRCMINPSLGPPLPLSERAACAMYGSSSSSAWYRPQRLCSQHVGSIVFGLATPTEGAACGALRSLVLTPPMEGSRGANSRTQSSRRSRSRCMILFRSPWHRISSA